MEGVALVDLGIGKRDTSDRERNRHGLGSASPYEQHPQKFIRTDSFTCRTVASSDVDALTKASVEGVAGSRHLPPLYPSSGANNGSTGGPNVYYNGGGIDESYDAASKTLQHFPSSLKSQGMGGGLALRCTPFTETQWQELNRQALIYKHFVSSAPVPRDLLFDHRVLPSIPPLYPNLARGGSAYFNLRFTNNTDPEPGRCRRTDGKKWRCSRDVAPDQKYCERHMHRGRPRSRKPVEQRQKTAAGAASVSRNISTTTTASPKSAMASTAPTNTAALGGSNTKPCDQSSPAVTLPFMFKETEKEPRYLDWMKGGLEEMHSSGSNVELRASNPLFSSQREEQFKLNYSYQNDPRNSLFNPDLSSLHVATYSDQRYHCASSIDAWSNEKPQISSAEKLPPSTLTLSMFGGGIEDADEIQMCLSINDTAGRSQPSSTVSTPGGPLAEVLQSGATSTSSPHNSSGEGEGSMSRSFAGLISLLGRRCYGSDDVVSPKDSPPRVVSSPTGVLQRTLVSFSDSSSNSSPTFGSRAGCNRSEMGRPEQPCLPQ